MSNKTSYIMDDALITLKQYDVATQTYYETNELYCNSTKYIYCLINYSLPKDLHISLLKIKFSVSNTTTTSFCVIPVYNNTFINSDFQEEAGLSDCIIGYEQCIDITKFLCENDSTSIALMIKPANDNIYLLFLQQLMMHYLLL